MCAHTCMAVCLRIWEHGLFAREYTYTYTHLRPGVHPCMCLRAWLCVYVYVYVYVYEYEVILNASFVYILTQ
jgi:hypothetical protein